MCQVVPASPGQEQRGMVSRQIAEACVHSCTAESERLWTAPPFFHIGSKGSWEAAGALLAAGHRGLRALAATKGVTRTDRTRQDSYRGNNYQMFMKSYFLLLCPVAVRALRAVHCSLSSFRMQKPSLSNKLFPTACKGLPCLLLQTTSLAVILDSKRLGWY